MRIQTLDHVHARERVHHFTVQQGTPWHAPLPESICVFPRRRQSYSEGMPSPYVHKPAVYISRQSLTLLRGMPLYEAALVLGISPTALKKACCKLGMDHWMYNLQSKQ